jgi:hypothetical protein
VKWQPLTPGLSSASPSHLPEPAVDALSRIIAAGRIESPFFMPQPILLIY